MAKEAYTKVPMLLSDGTEVVLKPLNIARLKRFMVAFDEMSEKTDDETTEENRFKNFDSFVACTGICLESELTEQFEETKAKVKSEKHISKEYREYLEEVLDMETIYMVLEHCAGMKLNDPNLLRAAAELMEDGKA